MWGDIVFVLAFIFYFVVVPIVTIGWIVREATKGRCAGQEKEVDKMSVVDTQTDARRRAAILRGLAEVAEAGVIDTALSLLSQAAEEASRQLYSVPKLRVGEARRLADEMVDIAARLGQLRVDLISALDEVADGIEEEARRLQPELPLCDQVAEAAKGDLILHGEAVPGAEITTGRDPADPTGYGPGASWD